MSEQSTTNRLSAQTNPIQCCCCCFKFMSATLCWRKLSACFARLTDRPNSRRPRPPTSRAGPLREFVYDTPIFLLNSRLVNVVVVVLFHLLVMRTTKHHSLLLLVKIKQMNTDRKAAHAHVVFVQANKQARRRSIDVL